MCCDSIGKDYHFIDLLFPHICRNPHLRKWKTGAGNFGQVSPKGSFCPLNLLLISLHFSSQVQPRFHHGQVSALLFINLPCRQEHVIPLIPHPPQVQPEVKTSHHVFQGNHQGNTGPFDLWSAQPRLQTLLTPFSFQCSRATWYSRQHSTQRHAATLHPITLLCALTWDRDTSLSKHPIQMDY